MSLIISGITLIIFQLIADMGNSNASSLNLIGFIAYCSVGIIGLILLIIGIRAKAKGKNATIIVHAANERKYTVLSYISATFVGIICLSDIIALFGDDFSQSLVFETIGSMLLLIYLIFYRGKKPSFLFPIAELCLGLSYIYGLFNLNTVYILSLENPSLYIIFSIAPRFISGVIYIILATVIYRESYTVSNIKILGSIVFALIMFVIIFWRLIVLGYFNLNIPSIILPLTIFLYTCVVPINNTPTTEEQSTTLKGDDNS